MTQQRPVRLRFLLRAAVVCALVLAPLAAAAETTPKALSEREKAEEGEKTIAAMREILAEVNKLVEEARGERDALRLNCVNERKSQISGLVKVAELALDELKAAIKERQPEAVEHEYNKILITREKVAGYKTEANQCIGLLAYYDGQQVERQFSDSNKDTPGLDPTTPVPVEPTPFRPPPASPIK